MSVLLLEWKYSYVQKEKACEHKCILYKSNDAPVMSNETV